MHPIGTKVVHLLTGDYGLVVEIPNCFKFTEAPWNTWVLWLTGEESFGKVLWLDPCLQEQASGRPKEIISC